jgi:D-alanyl-D-alanine carboxypeptidase
MKPTRPTTSPARSLRRRMRHSDLGAAPPASEHASQGVGASAPIDLMRDAQLDAAARQLVTSDLQRSIGNAAVARLVVQRGGPPPAATASPATPAAQPADAGVSAEDQAEYDLLKGKITDTDAAAYVKHRDKFFGSADAYREYAKEADAELTDTKGLRKQIELGNNPAAQDVFYRWVRKAYQKSGVADIPALIMRGKTKELKTAIAAVRSAYGKDFKNGGFNPRPMKSAKYQYRLGTISEHAMGKAVDVEHKRNPIISKKDWEFIETLAGKPVDRKLARWKSDPQALWQDIQDLNTLFVAALAVEVERITNEQAAAVAAGQKPKSKKKKQAPLSVALAGHSDLEPWKDGFFTLEWALVEQFHAQGFVWGATFKSSVDLHHFELS